MTRCPHSTKPNPGPCSQCEAVTPHIVKQVGRALLVDGKCVRLIALPPISPYTAMPRKRGEKKRK